MRFLDEPEYALFVEDAQKDGQAKGERIALFLPSSKRAKYLRESRSIARAIALRADPNSWSSVQVEDLARYTLIKSYEYKIPVALVLSLIEVESGFRTDAISNKGAMGLMQLMPETASYLAAKKKIPWHVNALFNPKVNIDMALFYLNELKARFKKPEWVIAAYNLGPSALEAKLLREEEPPMGFYRRVKSAMSLYEQQMKAPIAASASWRLKWL